MEKKMKKNGSMLKIFVMGVCGVIFAVMAVTPVSGQADATMTAFDILDRIDKNMVYKTAYTEMDMIIHTGRRVITKSLISYSRGNEQSFIEFLSPARDKGSKILKSDDIIRVYYPSAERVQRLSGHMMRKSMMGSDFSFEDMTERSKKMRGGVFGED